MSLLLPETLARMSRPHDHGRVVAELVFFHGTMNCGKSTLALQTHHNQAQGGRRGRLFTIHDRQGAVISTRIGLVQPATVVTPSLDFRKVVVEAEQHGRPLDYLICDEACFYEPVQIDQLAEVVDDHDVDVLAYGLLTDFTTALFPATARLLELADRVQQLQVRAMCWCGRPGSHNARLVDGVLQREGETVVVGDVDRDDRQQTLDVAPAPVTYEVLCRRHHRLGITRATSSRPDDTTP